MDFLMVYMDQHSTQKWVSSERKSTHTAMDGTDLGCLEGYFWEVGNFVVRK
jgi:hypothetical protein